MFDLSCTPTWRFSLHEGMVTHYYLIVKPDQLGGNLGLLRKLLSGVVMDTLPFDLSIQTSSVLCMCSSVQEPNETEVYVVCLHSVHHMKVALYVW